MECGQLGVAVLGTSRFALECGIPALQAHGRVRVIAVQGRDEAKVRRVAAAYDIPVATTQIEDVLAVDDVAAVYVVSANVDHYSQALACLRAGRHVLCEKPMAMDVVQAQELTRVARASGRVHQVGFTFRHNGAVQQLRHRLAQGAIGVPQFARIQYDRWDGLAPGWTSSWRDDPAIAGGGVLFDLGSHLYDILRHVLGPVEETIGFTHTVGRSAPDSDSGRMRQVATDDMAAAWNRHASGLLSQWFCSRVSSPLGELGYLEVIGDEGALKAALSRGGVDNLKQSSPARPEWRTEWQADVEDAPHVPAGVRRMIWRFVDACLDPSDDDGIAANFDDGLAVQLAMDRLIASQRSRSWEEIG